MAPVQMSATAAVAALLLGLGVGVGPATSAAPLPEGDPPPVLSDVQMTPQTFHRHGPGRPSLSFSVSEDARVRVTLVRRAKQGERSADTRASKPARGPSATFSATAGSFSYALRGNLRKSNLHPGRYRLEVRARDAAGQRDRAAAFFRVLR